VVTWTGNGAATQTINHNLGAVPGCIIYKLTSGADDWYVYHRSLSTSGGVPYWLNLNSTSAEMFFGGGVMLSGAPTSTSFTVKSAGNGNGQTYVAYIFAHNAGGFGLTGNDNVISCGSYTGTGGALSVTLGYEPQWLLVKRTSTASNWQIVDVMRGFPAGGVCQRLEPSTTIQEATSASGFCFPTATGFGSSAASSVLNNAGDTYIYIAIRRGPMKVPTSGTSVFSPIYSSSATGTAQTTNFPIDLQILRYPQSGYSNFFVDRLRGVATTQANQASPYITSQSTAAEASGSVNLTYGWGNTGFGICDQFGSILSIYHNFRRAPGFFDEVCYTGDGAANRTLTHNLTVAPELIILRKVSSNGYWNTFYNFGVTSCDIAQIESNAAASTSDYTGNFSKMGGAPTSSSFFVTNPFFGETNSSGTTYVAYLFATCPGVSKFGSYTGTGATQTINCGFTGGARFVLIKRADSTGDWYVWDTARGMVAGTDPSLLLNSTAAQVNANSVYTTGVGFQIVSTAAGINASGGSYIFLAIA
jgi:hypothetical protein